MTSSREVGFDLKQDAWGRLVMMDSTNRQHIGVEPVRAFPLSDPEHGIALCDAEGHELMWIDDLADLPGPIQEVLLGELAKREFVPVIFRVLKVSALVEPCEWQVETDRGPTSFLLQSEDDIHRLDEHRALVTDAHGIRYLIQDTRTLDSTSRRLLERYL
jgi:hypothetical protein